QDEADALVLGRRRLAADQAEHPVGLVGVRGPDLVAVDDEGVAVAYGARVERGQVGAGAGLAVALTPADFAAHDLRDVLGALLLAAELEQHRAEHPQPEALERGARVDAAHLLIEDRRFFRVQPAAAVWARPGRRGPAALGHAREP